MPPNGRRDAYAPRRHSPVGLEDGPLQLPGSRAARRRSSAREAGLLCVPHTVGARKRTLLRTTQEGGAGWDNYDTRAGEGRVDRGDASILSGTETSDCFEAVLAAWVMNMAITNLM